MIVKTKCTFLTRNVIKTHFNADLKILHLSLRIKAMAAIFVCFRRKKLESHMTWMQANKKE